jgi:hypothetical protein
MTNRLVLGLVSSIICYCAHADLSGSYQCDTIHKGQASKGVITIIQKDKDVSMTMQWQGKAKVISSDLMSTEDPNHFLSSWKGENSVGIALWEFKDNNLSISSTSMRRNNTSKIEETVTCIKQ